MKLIINADDFGLSQKTNIAIEKCFFSGIIDRTSIMVNMPGFEDAVIKSKESGFFDKVGMHLNLSEGRPLSSEILKTEFCTSDGYFNGQFIKRIENRFYLDRFTRKAVAKEIDEQLHLYTCLGFPLLHLDSHEHSHTSLSILIILLPKLKKYGFKTIRLSRNIPISRIKGIKSIYKKLINHIILGFNKNNGKGNNLFFGSVDDCIEEIETRHILKRTVEVMVHPIMDETNQRIKDSVNGYTEKNWTLLRSAFDKVNNNEGMLKDE